MTRTPSLDPVWAKGESLRGKRKDLAYRKLALFPEMLEACRQAYLITHDPKVEDILAPVIDKAADIMAQGQETPEGRKL